MIIQPRSLLDYCYPVGSIYTSTNSTPPAELFGGGTWTQIKDTFLLAAGDTYTAGSTGGSATVTPSGTVAGHTLATSEIPNVKFRIPHIGGYDICALNNVTETRTAMTYEGVRQDVSNSGWHNISFGGGGSHDHGLTMNSQTNMPPYKVVYAWERTA